MMTLREMSMNTTRRAVQIGNTFIGEGWPIYVIAEIGINHNGSIEIAKRLIEGAKKTGADIAGPVPLPTKREIFTVLRSPHVDKNSRLPPLFRSQHYRRSKYSLRNRSG